VRIALLIVALAGLAHVAEAQGACARIVRGRTSLVHGDRHAFIVQAPDTWTPVVVPGVPAAFHRAGETWRDATAVLYVNTFTFARDSALSPERAFLRDSAEFRADSPGLIVSARPPLRTADGRDAIVRVFRGDVRGNVEAIAYVRERTVLPLIVLSARSPAEFDAALPGFESLVRSYEFLTADRSAGDSLPCGIRRGGV
jgi:hypothetical protein